MKTVGLASVLFLSVFLAFGQDISTTTITFSGITTQVRFVSIKDEIFIDWTDLQKSLPDFFTVDSKGQVSVSTMFEVEILLGRAQLESSKAAMTATPSNNGAVTESNIDGEFSGWSGETIFKLSNGQVWEQSAYSYVYHYAFRPKVTIVSDNGQYVMSVEGMQQTVRVKRLQ